MLFFLAIRRFHRNGVLRGDASVALDPGDLVLLEQELHALRVLVAHSARALHRNAVIELHLTRADPEFRALLHLLGDRRGFQQCLGGNAAPQDAGAAEPFALDDCNGETELRGADCADVSGRSATDEDHII